MGQPFLAAFVKFRKEPKKKGVKRSFVVVEPFSVRVPSGLRASPQVGESLLFTLTCLQFATWHPFD